MKLLIVEDHKELSALLSAHLERIGFAVDRVFTGRNALHAIAMGDYDALLLDLGLPDEARRDKLGLSGVIKAPLLHFN